MAFDPRNGNSIEVESKIYEPEDDMLDALKDKAIIDLESKLAEKDEQI